MRLWFRSDKPSKEELKAAEKAAEAYYREQGFIVGSAQSAGVDREKKCCGSACIRVASRIERYDQSGMCHANDNAGVSVCCKCSKVYP